MPPRPTPKTIRAKPAPTKEEQVAKLEDKVETLKSVGAPRDQIERAEVELQVRDLVGNVVVEKRQRRAGQEGH